MLKQYTVRFTGTLKVWGNSRAEAADRAQAELDLGVTSLLAGRVGSLMEKGYIGKVEAAELAAKNGKPKFSIEYVG